MKDKLNEIPLLYDFYGQLLTEKQQQYLELYYYHDLSLGEIGQENGTTRQAVYDIIKRGEHLLQGYEQKLKLVERFQEEKQRLRELSQALQTLKQTGQTKEQVIDCIEKALQKFRQ